jgi:hypothetical protein
MIGGINQPLISQAFLPTLNSSDSERARKPAGQVCVFSADGEMLQPGGSLDPARDQNHQAVALGECFLDEYG